MTNYFVECDRCSKLVKISYTIDIQAKSFVDFDNNRFEVCKDCRILIMSIINIKKNKKN